MEKPIVEFEAWPIEVVIRFNPETRKYCLLGCDQNPVVAWGMLEYALSRVRRAMAQADLLEQMQNAPRVSLPGGSLA